MKKKPKQFNEGTVSTYGFHSVRGFTAGSIDQNMIQVGLYSGYPRGRVRNKSSLNTLTLLQIELDGRFYSFA